MLLLYGGACSAGGQAAPHGSDSKGAAEINCLRAISPSSARLLFALEIVEDAVASFLLASQIVSRAQAFFDRLLPIEGGIAEMLLTRPIQGRYLT